MAISEETLKIWVDLANRAERIESPGDSLYFRKKVYITTIEAMAEDIRALRKILVAVNQVTCEGLPAVARAIAEYETPTPPEAV